MEQVRKSKKVLAICLTCKKEFMDYPYNMKRVKNRFCSIKCYGISKKDKIPWNKGKKLPPHSLETRKKMSEVKRGNKTNFWKGGITPINKIIRRSFEYKLWREAVFKRDNYTCVWCNIRSGVGRSVYLNPDHIKSFANYPELRFAVDNGRTLCDDCHKTTNNYAGKARWSRDINNQLL